MEIFLKAIAGVLVAVVLNQVVQVRDKHFSVLLVLAVCCMVFTLAGKYIEQILAFFDNIKSIGGLNGDILRIMLKSFGICLLAELSTTICQDAGNLALGKMIQLISSVCVIWISLPAFSELITLAQSILEAA